MIVLVLLLMAYSLIGTMPHEILGMWMFVLYVVHFVLNFSWWKNIGKGRYTRRRILLTVVNVLLLVVMILLPFSGISMAKHLFQGLHIGLPTYVARHMHMLLSNWGFLLMSLHLGFHLNVMKGRLHIPVIPKPWGTAISVAFVVLGVRAFVVRGIAGYLTLQTPFAGYDLSESVILFLLDYLCVMAMCAVVGNWLLKKVK